MWIMDFKPFDLDLYPMTLVLKLDLDIIKMYVCTKNEVPTFSGSKVIIWTDTQTDRQTDRRMDRQTRLKLLPTAYADGKDAMSFAFTDFWSIQTTNGGQR